ncbi:MAG: hypothetical protein ACI379_05525 [Nocardioides sp.]|uniref:hypothetical protein n=1 Tax=Nocardioides sp. TaxID=35761 RepID=UPI003F0D5F38
MPHADADDYYWVPTSPPYVTPREPSERAPLMRSVFAERPAWVLSGSMMGWGDSVAAECDAIVFLTLETRSRMARLHTRQQNRNRVGDPDPAADEAFFAWAREYDNPEFDGRNRARHEEWLAVRTQPVLRMESSPPVEALAAAILNWEPTKRP